MRNLLATLVPEPDDILVAEAAGDSFSTTHSGGLNNDGTMFETASNGGEDDASTSTPLFHFNDADADAPVGLIADAVGDLFGATYDAGMYANAFGPNEYFGAVFEFVHPGGGSHAFNSPVGFSLGAGSIGRARGGEGLAGG